MPDFGNKQQVIKDYLEMSKLEAQQQVQKLFQKIHNSLENNI